jgi:hypothetical protein
MRERERAGEEAEEELRENKRLLTLRALGDLSERQVLRDKEEAREMQEAREMRELAKRSTRRRLPLAAGGFTSAKVLAC